MQRNHIARGLMDSAKNLHVAGQAFES